MSAPYDPADSSPWRRPVERLGSAVRGVLETLSGAAGYVGGIARMQGGVLRRLLARPAGRGGRMRRGALFAQMIRVGVRSIPIVFLVQIFIGVILALNMAPTLKLYGQLERVADVVAIAVFRELGPLISAIILSGFAGASIAAELGAMVEGEEIKALRATALDPIGYLVSPRILATTVMMVGLTVIADVIGVFGGFLTGVFVLGVDPQIYIDLTRDALTTKDYFTGLFKGGVFGAIIASLACYEGLNVQGGAVGVGRATTTTVVKSIVALIGADTVFTAVFYVLGW
ncbi:putative phospholipid ABC transporter permease protein MlaE [Phycisphaerae bacterium RAS1]|nr:putative phospholipid ABC transporter permease protein MlaE [Phycisphaerae bacterium RAS1]